MKRMLETSDNDADQDQPGGDEDHRTALSSLRGQGKKGKVGSVRVGAAKVSETPGVLVSSGQVPKSSNSSQFKIFQETNNEENKLPITTSSSSKSSNSHLPFSKERNRENERDPGKWTQNRIGKKSHAIPLDKISSKPGFDIHHDEGLVTPSKSSSMAPPSHVLSSHKPKP